MKDRFSYRALNGVGTKLQIARMMNRHDTIE